MSFKAEVIADSSGQWSGNGVRLATEEEAKGYAQNMADRWTLVTEWRVVPSDDPVNYKWTPGVGLGPVV